MKKYRVIYNGNKEMISNTSNARRLAHYLGSDVKVYSYGKGKFVSSACLNEDGRYEVSREGKAMYTDLIDTIATYMDDLIRERVHQELAPCTPLEFLKRYCKLDRNFGDTVLKCEFGIGGF